MAAVCGPVVVAGLMYLVFRPRLDIGANETAEHVLERIVMFYVIPPSSALIAGALLGDRLARPS